MSFYVIKRTDDEINRVVNWARDSQDQGTRYPGLSYEEGLTAMADWLTGFEDIAPDAD
ncbi:hypothetical protein LCGC14_0355010 [marine sediment metagenome]|uniref:Uncharacterized protein n=1 Tax=marine sediment metagenome TaxID=412755 RepID=A0A0F9VWV1_9ZZZZ